MQPDEYEGAQPVREFAVVDPDEPDERASEERAASGDDRTGDAAERDTGPHTVPEIHDTAQHRGDRI